MSYRGSKQHLCSPGQASFRQLKKWYPEEDLSERCPSVQTCKDCWRLLALELGVQKT